MLTVNNMKKIFIVILIIAVTPTLCLACGTRDHGTRVNIGAHTDFGLGLIVMIMNPNTPREKPTTYVRLN